MKTFPRQAVGQSVSKPVSQPSRSFSQSVRFDSLSRLHMWVEFAVGSRPCSERFISGFSGFPPSSKTNISKFQFNLEYTRSPLKRAPTALWCSVGKQIIFTFYSQSVSQRVSHSQLAGGRPVENITSAAQELHLRHKLTAQRANAISGLGTSALLITE